MSADTTVVIAAYRPLGEEGLSYTAAILQAVENLWDESGGVRYARANFLDTPRQWFTGPGALGRAKQFAHLLTQDALANGHLEYETQVMIEITDQGIYPLSRSGQRLPSRRKGG